MITGDLNTALVPWVVQYRITDPKMYLFGAREQEKTLRDLSESVMREVIGDRTVDEVLTIGRHDIETSTLKRLADLCSQYDLGIQIQQVQLTSVRPPPAVQAAFNDVNQAQQEKQTAINQAWSVYNDAVPNARGQAKEREKQAEAYAFRRVNEAKGQARHPGHARSHARAREGARHRQRAVPSGGNGSCARPSGLVRASPPSRTGVGAGGRRGGTAAGASPCRRGTLLPGEGRRRLV